MKLSLAILLVFTASSARGAMLSREEAMADLRQLAAIIKEDYGPLRLKQEKLGLELPSLMERYEERLRVAPVSGLPFELVRFAAEFRDSHFSVRLASREEANLGFTVDLIEGRALIDSIDRQALPEALFPFARGDELISLAGQNALEAARELASHFGMGRPETATRIGVMALTKRSGRSVPIPGGTLRLSFRRAEERNETTIVLPWRKTGAPATPAFLPAGLPDMCNERSQILPPPDADVLETPFTAFSFPTPKGRVGFLRIPHYYPTDARGEEEAERRFRQYENVVRRFEAETAGLIIDQNYNCGGSILFANKLMSLFAREPFTPAAFRFRASQGQIDGLSRHLRKFNDREEGYARFKGVVDRIIEARQRGLHDTDPIPLFDVMEVKLSLPGTETIAPNPIRYSKPVVLLINELSGSGGDLFPALMQDLGRARLLGHSTMGAGGHVWDDPHLELKHSRASVSLTRSLIVRPDGRFLENEGVTPDSSYELSRKDLLDGGQSQLVEAVRQLNGLL